MPNLRLRKKERLSSFRKIAIGTWSTAYDPSVYGAIHLRADKALDYLEEFRRRTGKKLTISHMMAKAVALVLADMPDANAILRFNRIYLREDIGVFFQVAMEDPKTGEIDLSGATIFDCHKKSMEEIVDEFQGRVNQVRAGKDKELEGTRSTFKMIPFFLLNFFLKALSFLLYTLNLDMRWAGVPRDAFGSAMVTNVGSLGLEEAYVPLVPYSKVALLVAVGAIADEPVVEDGKVVPAKMLKCFATFDHRVLDGMHASRMAKTLKRVFADPEAPDAFGPLPATVPAATATTPSLMAT
jgi:pyruvate dehydrogenase E2 component (dihydrolipoamide acetyltransferase)